MASAFGSFAPTKAFERDVKRLDAPQRQAVRDCIDDLMKDPVPGARRLHLLNPKRAGIYSVDLYTNTTTYKLTFTLDGTHATLRRVGTHKEIDRAS